MGSTKFRLTNICRLLLSPFCVSSTPAGNNKVAILAKEYLYSFLSTFCDTLRINGISVTPRPEIGSFMSLSHFTAYWCIKIWVHDACWSSYKQGKLYGSVEESLYSLHSCLNCHLLLSLSGHLIYEWDGIHIPFCFYYIHARYDPEPDQSSSINCYGNWTYMN